MNIEKGIILFDGECNLCNRSVQFIIKRDPERYFHFLAQQSKMGKELLAQYDAPKMDSLYLIDKGKCFYKSTAALRITRHLKGMWKLAYVFILVPRPLRDVFYNWIAKNRYDWFGKQESCLVPSPENRGRFL